VLEKGMLRNVLVSRRKEETGDWTKLHNKELHDLQYSLIIMYINIFLVTRPRSILLGPAGLLCNPESPSIIFDAATSAARCLHVHATRETLVAKGGTSRARTLR
jgi:hypothetical protein